MQMRVGWMFGVCALACACAWGGDAYVESDGTQLVDTGYYATPQTKVEADFAYTDLTQQQRSFGCEGTDAALTFCSYICGGNEYAWATKNGAGDYYWSGVKVSTDRVKLVMDSPNSTVSVYTNGDVLASSKAMQNARTVTATAPFAIFGVSTGPVAANFNSSRSKIRLYSLKIYESGTLVHDFEPYKANGVYCLKDAVTGFLHGTVIGNALTGADLADDVRAYTWTGTTDSDWAKAANWTLNGAAAVEPPTACDTVTIPAGTTVSLAHLTVSAKTLTFSGSGTVTLADAGKVALAESVTVPSGVTLALDASALLYFASGTLTVGGAAIADGVYTGNGSTGTSAAWLSGAGRVIVGAASVQPCIADKILYLDVPSGLSLTYTTTIGTEITNIVKRGAGTAIISNDLNTAFVGTVQVRQGILEAQYGVVPENTTATQCAVFGTAAGNTITVSNGAQLRVRGPGPKDQGNQIFKNNLVIAGDGPDGRGALYYIYWTKKVASTGKNCSGNVDRLFTNVTLSDDASFTATTRMGFSSGTLDLNGHTLTYRRLTSGLNSQFMNTNEIVKNGTLNLINSSDYILQGSPKLQGNATMSLGSGCLLDTWNAAATFDGLVIAKEGSYFRVGAGNERNSNTLKGPFRLDGKLNIGTYSTNANLSATFAGLISGTGKLASVYCIDKSSQTHHYYLTCPTNSWTGGVVMDWGTVWSCVPGSVPPGPLTSTTGNGRLNFVVGEQGSWGFPELHNILTNWDGKGAANVYTASGISTNDTADITTPIIYRHAGPGTVTFSGKTSPEGKTKLRNGEGNFVITGCGEARYVSDVNVSGGTMTLDNAGLVYTAETDGHGTVTLTNKDTYVSGAGARLVVKGTSAFVSKEVKDQNRAASLYVNNRAVLELQDSAVITNCLHLGEGSVGAVYQTGGYFYDTATAGNDGSIGQGSGYGYYGLSAGTYTFRSWQALGRTKASEGVFDQSGGSVIVRYQPLCVSRGGQADYHMTGGTLTQLSGDGNSQPGVMLGNFSWGDKAAGPMEAILTMAGDNPEMTLSAWFCLTERTNTAVSVLNLNAGVLEAPYIAKAYTSFLQTENKPSGWKDVYGYVNFNGGAYRARRSWTSKPIFSSGGQSPDAVTVFAGGATIDVNGKSITNGDVPFVRPVGKGVASVTIPSGTTLTGYLGAPKVLISGGGGAGATAHCAFDRTTGTIGPITVTSPGWGYTSAPTATIKSGDRKTTITCTTTLTDGEQVSGGLTVTNSHADAGTFTLGGTNTYAGATVIAGGTLKIASTNALPAGGEVRCAGGTLDLNNLGTVKMGAFGGAGSVKNGTVEATSLTFAAADLAAGQTLALSGKLILPAAAPVTVTGVTASFAAKKYTLLTATGGIEGGVGEVTGFDAFPQPQLWRVSKVGNSIILAYTRGTVFIFR